MFANQNQERDKIDMAYQNWIRISLVLKKERHIALRILCALLIFVILQSCSKEDDLPLVMADGNKITLSNNKIVYYGNESDFLHSYTSLFPCKYTFISNNKGPYLREESYSIEGYDDRFIGYWEKAKFGDWIKKYGLEPDKVFYCATIKYVSYVPIPLPNEDYIPIMPLNNMGYSPWTTNKSFDIDYRIQFPKYLFYTCLRYIGYDDKLAGVYIELPLTNKLIWNFTVK